jgi:hypothetical protein
LRPLACRQERRVDPVTLEEPGKIGHEFRLQTPSTMIDAGRPGRGEFNYNATADATSWFLFVLSSLGDRPLADELEHAWRGAGGWLVQELDRSGGLVRHAPSTVPGGLVQQGWRDSHDPRDPYGGGILHAGGRLPGQRSLTPTPRRSRTPPCGRSTGSTRVPAGTSGRRHCRGASRPRSGPR